MGRGSGSRHFSEEVWVENPRPFMKVKKEIGPYRPKKRTMMTRARQGFRLVKVAKPVTVKPPKKDGHHQPQPIQVKQELDDQAQVVAVDPSIERSMMIGLWNRVKLEQEKDDMRRGRSHGSLSRN